MMTREEIDDRLAKLPAWKVQKFYELKKRHEEYSKSPELISRANSGNSNGRSTRKWACELRKSLRKSSRRIMGWCLNYGISL